MNVHLSKFCKERLTLLERIVAHLEKDSRVVSAWLFGSIGRGDPDELSDIDIWIVVSDDFIQNLTRQRRQFVSRIGTPLLVVEAPQNAPKNGAYLMVYYESAIAPLQVDWYWQPQSDAFIPPDTKLLFDHIGLESADKPIEFANIDPDPALTEDPGHFVGYFWAMLLITTKYALRDPWSEKIELLPYVIAAFQQTQRYLNHKIIFESQEILVQKHPKAKLLIIRKLAAEMMDMMTDLEAKGLDMPQKFAPGMNNYLEMLESRIKNI